MNLNEYDVSNPYSATLVSSEQITPENSGAEVRHLLLELPDGDFDFVEGQSIGVLAPGPHDFGNPHHLRLYSIASSHKPDRGVRHTISICVRRCFYVDQVSGEEYPGKASNYLCDLNPGASIKITGPYGSHFQMPPDDTCHMLMVGVGTGIAPFRAFTRNIYAERGGWRGKVRLFYGARSGTEMLYRNEKARDLALYYDDDSFRAFEAVSARPYFDEEPPIDRLLMDNSQEVWELMQDPKTYVYVAGLANVAGQFEKAMIAMAGSEKAWHEKKADLISSGRYAELLY